MKRYLFAASLLCVSVPSWALGNLADISVYDRGQGRNLTVYEHEGRHYVVGKPGNRYQIILRNQSGQSLLAVTSVDGANVVSGETAHWQQSGYVLDSFGQTDIKGWRKSLSHVAQFYFTSLADSYAARSGRPDNVGVIGVALFRQRNETPIAQIAPDDSEMSERDARAADKAPAESRGAMGENSAPSQVAPRAKVEKKLGTGHGRNETSQTRYVDFERASDSPDEVVTIYYDSYRNLLAQGVIPRHRSAQVPIPFPGQFVPDPQY
jgi:hypothetical protein